MTDEDLRGHDARDPEPAGAVAGEDRRAHPGRGDRLGRTRRDRIASGRLAVIEGVDAEAVPRSAAPARARDVDPVTCVQDVDVGGWTVVDERARVLPCARSRVQPEDVMLAGIRLAATGQQDG